MEYKYNFINLHKSVKSGDIIKARYVYTADGNKPQVRDGDGTGALKEQNDYYAFGARQKRADYLISDNRYRYNGKEVQTTGDLGFLDYGARMYDAGVGRWFGMDPAEQYASGYVFCGNNPVKFIDPDGRFAGDFIDRRGRYLGNDGIDDHKIYVMKTSEKKFGNDDPADGAGVPQHKIKKAINFIKRNSGDKEAFSGNSMAYDNSVEIEGSQANRQAMVDEVSKDNGKGGVSEANNREYGGSLSDGVVKIAEPGAVANPKTQSGASIMLPANVTTFHSHPSGNVSTSTDNGSNISYFNQHPSSEDTRNASTRLEYVFGRGNGTVYIYNSSGVQATIPMRRFVLMKR